MHILYFVGTAEGRFHKSGALSFSHGKNTILMRQELKLFYKIKGFP